MGELAFLHHLQQFKWEGHFGVAEEVEAEGYLGGAVGVTVEDGFHAGEAAGLHADFAAGVEEGGVDGDGRLCIAHKALEVEHLGVGDAGEVVAARGGDAGTVREEVENEFRLTGYAVADCVGAADE